MNHTLRLAILFLLAVSLAAQAPSVRELAQQAHGIALAISTLKETEPPTATTAAELATAQKNLTAFVQKCRDATGLTAEHYVAASSPFLHTEPAAAIAISEAGLRHFAQARFLWDHVGIGHVQVASAGKPDRKFVASLRAAEQAFRRALPCEPDTYHAHLGLYRTLELLGDADGALVQFEATVQDPQGAAALGTEWPRRASLLLRAGKAKDALRLLASDEAKADGDENTAAWLPILTLRATALTKDAAATTQAAMALVARDRSLRAAVHAADALAFVGKHDEALRLLAARPGAGPADDEERTWAKSAQALTAFWAAKDRSSKGPLRLALTKALGHRFEVMDGKQKPPAAVDLSSSPAAMAHLVAQAPTSAAKDWGNRILLALCLRAMPDHEPTPLEQQVMATSAATMPQLDDLPALQAAARFAVGDPEAGGALTGLFAIDLLSDGKPTGKPAGGK